MTMTTKTFMKQNREEPIVGSNPIYVGNDTVDTVDGAEDISGEGKKPGTQSPITTTPQPKGPIPVATFTGAGKNPSNTKA